MTACCIYHISWLSMYSSLYFPPFFPTASDSWFLFMRYLIRIGCIDTIITFITDTVVVQVGLVGIWNQRTIIVVIRKTIIVNIIVASIADTIFIEVQLIVVDNFWAIIACIALFKF